MADAELHHQIDALEAEAEELRRRQGHSEPLGERETARLGEIEVEVDRLWDLVRQREARRQMGQDPDTAAERPADVVEGYQQ